jgi:hypothetical protein
MDQELKEYLEAMENRLQVHADGVESRLREHTEKIETQLLTEFWKWAKTSDIKTRQNHGTITLIDERIAAVEDRVSELERRRA